MCGMQFALAHHAFMRSCIYAKTCTAMYASLQTPSTGEFYPKSVNKEQQQQQEQQQQEQQQQQAVSGKQGAFVCICVCNMHS